MWHIYPRWPQIVLSIIPAMGSFLLTFWESGIWLVMTVDIGIVVFCAIDLLSLPYKKSFQVNRKTQKIASLRKNHAVAIDIQNQSGSAALIELRDDVPPNYAPQPAEFRAYLQPQTRSTLEYQFQPDARGEKKLTKIFIRARSRWGLWLKDLVYDCPSTVNVYPDMKQLEEYSLLARTNRLSMLGMRRTRKIGQDNEFERLRDFTRDDIFKHIDWRSSARRRKLTVKDFQSNQSQRIIFMIDCGRMMTNEANGISLLDHAFNAMLMLSYIAIRQGDSVGMLCFSDEIHSYVPPKSGGTQMNHLLHACFNQFPRLVESRYDEAFLYLASHCHKRSLVILISNVIDDVNANQIHQYLGSAAGRHLALGVLLRDRTLFEAADHPPKTEDELFQSAAAADLLIWRNQVLTQLHTQGVRVMDLYPEELTAPLVNAYMDIKARHLL